MPTYSYKCPQCGHDYSKLQKITDRKRAKCPACGTRGERVITGGGGLIFKGSGFYITDYKRAGDKKGDSEKPERPEKPDKAEKLDKAAKSEPKTQAGGKGESKPQSKSGGES